MSISEETRVDYDEGTRDEETHQTYPGYDELVSYLTNQAIKSFQGFLFRLQEVVLSSSSNTSWKNLDHYWFNRFKSSILVAR
ncbi:14224_t:CDS:2 [Funneliformis mosseae]|uniref:14224_t:CDS:1 n=1 Tax=Funneliformis mosseae TaxID=27381 RepID=A0A9N9BJ73_FUNMO|nr:14224_t:CDS:2 [Funneliformis mosseae]